MVRAELSSTHDATVGNGDFFQPFTCTNQNSDTTYYCMYLTCLIPDTNLIYACMLFFQKNLTHFPWIQTQYMDIIFFCHMFVGLLSLFPTFCTCPVIYGPISFLYQDMSEDIALFLSSSVIFDASHGMSASMLCNCSNFSDVAAHLLLQIFLVQSLMNIEWLSGILPMPELYQ